MRQYNINIFSLILLVLTCTACTSINIKEKYPPTSRGEIIEHSFYSLSYIEKYEQAEWVYYVLYPQYVNGDISRTDDFREDLKIKSRSSQLSDYTNSGYDRGHLCPAGSMTHSEIAMSESFYMSNMSPQIPSLNRGAWKQLEEKVRGWVNIYNMLHIVTGPIFSTNMAMIGESRVAVPQSFYKIIYSPYNNKMIAFIMPNNKIEGEVFQYITTVDEVEKNTGIDFFAALSE